MFKKYFAFVLLSSFVVLPAIADDAVFSNSESQQFNLQPLNYDSVPVVKSQDATTVSKTTSQSATLTDNQVSDQNFLNAINNLDNAQVEIREQMASTSALMAQAKTNYETRKDEYKTYKKQYKTLKKKLRSVEKSKEMIQGNVSVSNTTN